MIGSRVSTGKDVVITTLQWLRWLTPILKKNRITVESRFIFIITIFAIRQLQHELQRWSLINIPREKKAMEIINEKKGYLVLLTKTTSLLYLHPANLWSTPLVVLVPPFLIAYPIAIPSKFLLRVHTPSPRHWCASIIPYPLTRSCILAISKL